LHPVFLLWRTGVERTDEKTGSQSFRSINLLLAERWEGTFNWEFFQVMFCFISAQHFEKRGESFWDANYWITTPNREMRIVTSGNNNKENKNPKSYWLGCTTCFQSAKKKQTYHIVRESLGMEFFFFFKFDPWGEVREAHRSYVMMMMSRSRKKKNRISPSRWIIRENLGLECK
jgi:hypothetical protein